MHISGGARCGEERRDSAGRRLLVSGPLKVRDRGCLLCVGHPPWTPFDSNFQHDNNGLGQRYKLPTLVFCLWYQGLFCCLLLSNYVHRSLEKKIWELRLLGIDTTDLVLYQVRLHIPLIVSAGLMTCRSTSISTTSKAQFPRAHTSPSMPGCWPLIQHQFLMCGRPYPAATTSIFLLFHMAASPAFCSLLFLLVIPICSGLNLWKAARLLYDR